ncbi:MAG TPA: hypothetical protein VG389_06880 [Myxococcota bacterium]|jgi:hypothetical protein|nr:hypothetical protein [Myxococcota bacterium]
MLVKKDQPRWSQGEALLRGQNAHALAQEDASAILERLTRTLPELRGDLDLFAEVPVEARDDLVDQKAATRSKQQVAERGHGLVRDVRHSALRRAPKDETLHTKLGVGDNLHALDYDGVAQVLDKIVELGGAAQDGLESIGVLPADVALAAELVAALRDTRSEQESKRTGRASGTVERRALHLRIESMVDEIGTAGLLVYRDDALRRARYEALFASPPAADAAPGTDPPAGPPPALPPSQG